MSQRICPTCNGNGWVDDPTPPLCAATITELRRQIDALVGRLADSTETGNRVTHRYVKRADVLAILDAAIK